VEAAASDNGQKSEARVTPQQTPAAKWEHSPYTTAITQLSQYLCYLYIHFFLHIFV
jgi:hypothetical protein